MRRALVHAVSECSRIVYSMPDAREQQETLSRLSYCFGHHDLQPRAVCVLEGTGAVDSRMKSRVNALSNRDAEKNLGRAELSRVPSLRGTLWRSRHRQRLFPSCDHSDPCPFRSNPVHPRRTLAIPG